VKAVTDVEISVTNDATNAASVIQRAGPYQVFRPSYGGSFNWFFNVANRTISTMKATIVNIVSRPAVMVAKTAPARVQRPIIEKPNVMAPNIAAEEGIRDMKVWSNERCRTDWM
jgi:hypothetical protein